MPKRAAPSQTDDGKRTRLWWRLFTLFLSLLICCGAYYHIAFWDTPIRIRTPWHYERVGQRTVTVPYHTPAPVVETSLPLAVPQTPAP